MTSTSIEAVLAPLEALVGAWKLEAIFPHDPSTVLGGVRCTFEWMSGKRFLVQRTEAPAPIPGSLAIIGIGADGRLVQHYFDTRGVARLYAMSFDQGTWKLQRETADFSPLDFKQRFEGKIEDGGKTIRGAWEKTTTPDGADWALDFHLVYRKVG